VIRLPVLQRMRCDDDCGECCGIVPVTLQELEAVDRYRATNGIEAQRNGVTCPFFQGGRCAVYEARPSVCRLFGHTPKMRCPRGYRPVKDVARRHEQRMAIEVLTDVDADGVHFLHTLAGYDMRAIGELALGERVDGVRVVDGIPHFHVDRAAAGAK